MIITILLCGLSFFFGVFFTFYIFKRFYGIDLFEESRRFNKQFLDKSNKMKERMKNYK